jgi:hypothetical protein
MASSDILISAWDFQVLLEVGLALASAKLRLGGYSGAYSYLKYPIRY